MRNWKIFLLGSILLACGNDSDIGTNSNSSDGVSQGGSLARFTIVDNHLYIVNDLALTPVDINTLSNPIEREKVFLGEGIETIFSLDNTLFIGSRSAVYILSLNNPDNPQILSTYTHTTGCDPVIVQGNYAYVTLRSGVSCNSFVDVNVLEVLDISNLRFPRIENTIFMTNPAGLAIGCDNRLFVGERENGLVQFNLDNPAKPEIEVVYPNIAANDIIIRDELVIITGSDGVFQYSCSSDTLQLLGQVPIQL